ncbi:Protein kinase, putative [Hondaea fermentalgiana]|uniref:Protein kinase, putative n=1 Tax=Hondaea fermentalgiana TaxID=2315210 RepID=A0A2R5G7K7_9STRA|nr:Protein kinase, putative [Hondaea fermentalgiana]|eukprot:GBG24021.1 Protein kinase, putative [Hondaea fermentalgiana]
MASTSPPSAAEVGCEESSCMVEQSIFAATAAVLALSIALGLLFIVKQRRRLRLVRDLDKAMLRQQGITDAMSRNSLETAESLKKGGNTASLNEPQRQKLPWEIRFPEIKLQERVAYGTSGAVWKGQWMDMTVAVKIPHEGISELLRQSFIDEAFMMSKLHHPNIVIFYGACLSKDNLALVLEFLERGSMHDFLKNESEKVDFSMLHHFATDIARGMKYLHQRCSIIQRDLKPRNLLIDEAYNVKICDFGLSKHMNVKEEGLTACGTPYWTAPEVILGEEYNNKADVFSYAIILWELITREEPYSGLPGLEVAIKVANEGLRPRIPKFCPEPIAALIEECWQHDSELRPSFGEILERLLEIKKSEAEQGLLKSSASPDLDASRATLASNESNKSEAQAREAEAP